METITEYEANILELEDIKENYFVLNEEMERKNELCHEQENELADWRFKYSEFVTT